MLNLLSVSAVFSTVISIFFAILVLLIMITIHEFGHYIAGKIFKFKINEFAIGMGPAIFKRKSKKSGEVFSVRVLPLGGYCAFEGEDEDSDNKDAFNNKEPWKRLIVLLSGAVMNFILGVFVLILSIGLYGQLLINVKDVAPAPSNYEQYSLYSNDIIVSVEGKDIFMASDISSALKGKKQGDVVNVYVNSNGERVLRKVKLRNDVSSDNLTDTFSSMTALGIATVQKIDGITPTSNVSSGEFLLRIKDNEKYEDCTRIYQTKDLINYAKTINVNDNCSYYITDGNSQNGYRLISVEITRDLSNLGDLEVLKILGISKTSSYLNYQTTNCKFSFFETIKRGSQYSIVVAGTIFTTLGELLTGKLGISAMGGPITTISMTSSAIRVGGFNFFLEIMGFIGVNLAVFNLLPIPALDGSRAVFTTIEWIRKKPINRKVEGIIHAIGLVFLLGFCILVDLLQLL